MGVAFVLQHELNGRKKLVPQNFKRMQRIFVFKNGHQTCMKFDKVMVFYKIVKEDNLIYASLGKTVAHASFHALDYGTNSD